MEKLKHTPSILLQGTGGVAFQRKFSPPGVYSSHAPLTTFQIEEAEEPGSEASGESTPIEKEGQVVVGSGSLLHPNTEVSSRTC